MKMLLDLRPQVENLVRQAGELLLQWWPGGTHPVGELIIEHKPDGTRVSNADLASNEILVSGLEKLLPGVPVISEELPKDPSYHKADVVWIIDPLDGTSAFIEGRNDFSILVALVEREIPIFGVMYFPQKGLFGAAIRGQGATLNGQPLRVNSEGAIRPGRLALSKLDLSGNPLRYPHPIDSGMAFFDIARGELDAFVIRIKTHREWDIAAPAIILQESGGVLSDEQGASLLFNQPEMKWRYVVAGNRHCHNEALAIVRSCLENGL